MGSGARAFDTSARLTMILVNGVTTPIHAVFCARSNGAQSRFEAAHARAFTAISGSTQSLQAKQQGRQGAAREGVLGGCSETSREKKGRACETPPNQTLHVTGMSERAPGERCPSRAKACCAQAPTPRRQRPRGIAGIACIANPESARKDSTHSLPPIPQR